MLFKSIKLVVFLQGRNCEVDLNMCRSDPCLNGGTCSSIPNMIVANSVRKAWRSAPSCTGIFYLFFFHFEVNTIIIILIR